MSLRGAVVLMSMGLLGACNQDNERAPSAQPLIKVEVSPNPSANPSASLSATTPQPVPATAAPEPRAIKPWDATACGDDAYQNEKLQRHPALMGLAPEPLTRAYGAPSAEQNFRVGEPLGTFYGAYGKRRSGPKAANEGAPARVLTWTKSSCNFSVFFLKQGETWQAVEAFEWAVGAEF
jgi:hypothetical protein